MQHFSSRPRQRRSLALLSLLVGLAHLQLWSIAQAEPAGLRHAQGPLLVRVVDAAQPDDKPWPATATGPATFVAYDVLPTPAAPNAVTQARAPQRPPTTRPLPKRAAQPVPTDQASPSHSESSDARQPAFQAETAPALEPDSTAAVAAEPVAPTTTAVVESAPLPALAPSLAQLTPRSPRPEGKVQQPAATPTTPRSDALPAPPVRAPASVTLRYTLRRGALTGDGDLTWRHDGRTYSLDLVARLPILGTIFQQHSRGQFEPVGLAPVRYSERRLAKSERAVNFVRPDDGSPSYVAFSANSGRQALPAGMQDRVSWMVQLAARLQAWPSELQVGQRLDMPVAGPNGDVQAWRFLVKESAVSAEGERQWRLLREAEQPHETQAEVWVSPQRGYFPIRVRLTESQGEPLELTLK